MIVETLIKFAGDMGIFNMDFRNAIMLGVACLFLFLAVNKGLEPLLLVPIGFGMLL